MAGQPWWRPAGYAPEESSAAMTSADHLHRRQTPLDDDDGSDDHDGGKLIFSTAVAIDTDKNSQAAVKWAVENLKLKGNGIILVHVLSVQPYTLTQHHHDFVPKEGRAPTQSEMQQMFLPYRGFCARKGIRVKEMILHDVHIGNALSEFIAFNRITSIVLGACTRNAISRAFKVSDVPNDVAKYAPNFCSVYVASKGGKVLKAKSATELLIPEVSPDQSRRQGSRSGASEFPGSGLGGKHHRSRDMLTRNSPINSKEYQFPAPWRPHLDIKADSPQSSMSSNESQQSLPWEKQHGSKNPTPAESASYNYTPFRSNNSSPMDSAGSDASEYDNRQLAGTKISVLENHHLPVPLSGSSDQSDVHSYNSDLSYEFLDNSRISNSSRSSTSSQATVEAEDELRRLKLELKQVTEKYNAACKEAVIAREMVQEIGQLKSGGGHKAEGMERKHDSLFAMLEREKHMQKAAVVVATKAQRIAELESEKRRFAETKYKMDAEERKRAVNALACSMVRYRKYSIDEIEAATSYFSESDKVGEGGYGPVYKAFLDHTPVAIKILRPGLSKGQQQFQKEVEVLSRMRHPHMVTLLGACPENGCLVYEYMENGSLEDRLFCKNGTPPLSWRDRFRIAAEIGIALNFLHQTKPEPLVHRDLKPANILLDKNYVSKISDVGLARLVPPSVADSISQYCMTAAAGTFCYIDPEYQQTGMLGTKSDVYSLGILLLQLITAKPPIGLTHKVESAIEKGKFSEILDHGVMDWPEQDALSFAKLALACCELRRKDRPSLDSVILPKLEQLRDLGSGMEGRHCDNSQGLVSHESSYSNQDSRNMPKFSRNPVIFQTGK